MPDKHVPQDSGTGLPSQSDRDWIDAANAAANAHDPNYVQCVVTGMGFTVDYANNLLDVGAGQARLLAQNVSTVDHGSGTISWPEITQTVYLEGRTGLALTDNDVNFVYLSANQGSPDDVSIVINTTGTAPSAPSLKLGEVDTGADTATEQNREPDATFSSVTTEEIGTYTEVVVFDGVTGLKEYAIADYADLGAAIQAAITDQRNIPESAKIVIPPSGSGGAVSSPIQHEAISAWHANIEGVVVGRDTSNTPHGSALASSVGAGNNILERTAGTGSPDRGTLLRGFAIVGDGTEDDGIHWEEWAQHTGVENVIVTEVGQDGFSLSQGIFSMKFEGMKAFNCGRHGIYLFNDVNANGFHNPQATGCGTHGMFIDASSGPAVGNTVHSPTFSQNGSNGFRQQQGGAIDLVGGDYEQNTGSDIYLLDVQGGSITGAQISGGATAVPGIVLDGAAGISVDGVRSRFDAGDSTTPHVRLTGSYDNITIGPMEAQNGGAVVEVATDNTGRVSYDGPPSEVDNATGSVLTNPVICHGDDAIYYKASTGTGYDGGTNDTQL